MCSDFRDAGVHWKNIRAECKERKISAVKWATENAPISLRWLDKYGQFSDRWDEFLEIMEVVKGSPVCAGEASWLMGRI